jgi:pyrimidine 5'-nucleotidase
MKYSTLFFDLDDTLYPPGSGVWQAIGVRIDQYIHEVIGIPSEEAFPTREKLFKTYGTTLRGLHTLYGIDVHQYLDFVHDIPLKDYLESDPKLREILLSYPHKKVIFTNADRGHAQRTLKVLGLEDCFDDIIDILDVYPHCKPDIEAFEIALKKAGETDYQRCILVDDYDKNLLAARELGFYTIKPHSCTNHTIANACIATITDLPEVLDSLLR